jgi:transposase
VPKKYTAEMATRIAKDHGYRPAEDFPGRASAPWRIICDICGIPRVITLTTLRAGRCVCKHRRGRTAPTNSKQIDELTDRMVKMYNEKVSIRAIAKKLGISYFSVHRRLNLAGVTFRPRGGDARSAPRRKPRTEQDAVQIAKKAGYTPREPYPGQVNATWEVICDTCETPRKVRLAHVLKGITCKHVRGRTASREQRERAAAEGPDLYREGGGVTVASLAGMFGVSASLMNRYLKDAGVEMRRRGRGPRSPGKSL